jgi:ribosomal protein S7
MLRRPSVSRRRLVSFWQSILSSSKSSISVQRMHKNNFKYLALRRKASRYRLGLRTLNRFKGISMDALFMLTDLIKLVVHAHRRPIKQYFRCIRYVLGSLVGRFSHRDILKGKVGVVANNLMQSKSSNSLLHLFLGISRWSDGLLPRDILLHKDERPLSKYCAEKYLRGKFFILKRKHYVKLASSWVSNYINVSLNMHNLDTQGYKLLGTAVGGVGYFKFFKRGWCPLFYQSNLGVTLLRQCMIRVGNVHRSEKILLSVAKTIKSQLVTHSYGYNFMQILDWIIKEVEPGVLRVLRIKRGRGTVLVPILTRKKFSISKGIRWLLLDVQLKQRSKGKKFHEDLTQEMLQILDKKSVVLKRKSDMWNLILESRGNIGLLKRTLRASRRNNFGVI